MSVVPVNVAISTSVPTLTLAAGSAGGVAVASTIDPAVDYLLIYTASAVATQGISRNVLLGLSSQPAGISDSQALSNKTLGITNTFTPLDGSFTLKNTADPTKLAIFSLAGITTGTTRIYTLPNASGTLMDLASAQTATNKTLTSPVINSPNITNATLTTDTITGFTTSTLGTIYGLSISSGVLNTNNSVVTSNLAAGAVTAAKMQFGLVRKRQGNTSGSADWSTAGTTNTDTSAIAAFIQCGSFAAGANATYSVTFPVAFTYQPIITVGARGGGAAIPSYYIVQSTVTNAGFQVYSASANLIDFHWIAIGQ